MSVNLEEVLCIASDAERLLRKSACDNQAAFDVSTPSFQRRLTNLLRFHTRKRPVLFAAESTSYIHDRAVFVWLWMKWPREY
jgi:hypothetical protein